MKKDRRKKKNLLKGQEGFTLIEIIAVIIIMGILAAVAVPKFFSMQEDAKVAACHGALSEATARFNHAYAKYILVMKKAPADVANDLTTITDPDDGSTITLLGANAAGTGTDIGDFVVTWNKQADDTLKIEIQSADTIGNTALTQLKTQTPDPTVKTVDGITWGS